MATVTVPASKESKFSTSDDTPIVNQIKATHSPNSREIDVTALLHFIEDIFNRAAPNIPGSVQGGPTQTEALDSKAFLAGYGQIFELLSDTIKRIKCEISCKVADGRDAHTTTLAIFYVVSSYFWDAKAALALAAFAVDYGEFLLDAQLYPTNSLAKSVAVLKQIPDIVEHADFLKPKFEAISNLTRPVTKVAWCIDEFKKLPQQYISPDAAVYETASALIPIASYWIIRSIVACTSQIIDLQSMSYDGAASRSVSTSLAWELSTLAHKVNNIYEHLRKQLDLCNQHIEKKKNIEEYRNLIHLFETPHLDNMKILNSLIPGERDQLPLVDGSSKEKVSMDVLKGKNVLLLISDLDISEEELLVLEQIYEESRSGWCNFQYEIVWLPVTDRTTPWNEQQQKQFQYKQKGVPWYTLYQLSLLDSAVTRYIKEVWHFDKKAKLVALDGEGRVVNPNAIEMMWIWGNMAFPFTGVREEQLWREETWRLELLVDSIEPLLFEWIEDGKCICLYGGEDMEWIRKFTVIARAAAHAVPIPLELLYVGKRNLEEKLQMISDQISRENLSHVLPAKELVWFFWVRLECMWHSKIQQRKSAEDDPIMQEILTMMSFGESEPGWAVISLGPDMARAKGDIMLACFNEFDEWKADIPVKGFVPAIKDYLKKLQTPHRCNRLLIPGTSGSVPDKVVCPECGRVMEKFIRFRCRTDKTYNSNKSD